MNLSSIDKGRKGIAMDSYGASRNKKIQSDDEFLRGPRKSKVRFHDIIYIESYRIAYIVMIQFGSTYFFLLISHFSDLIGTMEKYADFGDS